MIIAIDAGNTFTKWKVFDSKQSVQESGRFHNIDGWQSFLLQLRQWQPEKIIIASVVDGSMQVSLQQIFGEHIVQIVVSEKACLGVQNSYAQPQKLGVDRWLAAIEAWHLGASPGAQTQACAVIDIGTAAKLDVVDPSGQHLGGHIVPGLAMMAKVLQQDTQKVRYDALGIKAGGYGCSTGEAVERGVWSMLLSWILGEVEHFYQQFPEGRVYLSGGAAEQFLQAMPQGVAWHKDLVLDGLYRIAASEL